MLTCLLLEVNIQTYGPSIVFISCEIWWNMLCFFLLANRWKKPSKIPENKFQMKLRLLVMKITHQMYIDISFNCFQLIVCPCIEYLKMMLTYVVMSTKGRWSFSVTGYKFSLLTLFFIHLCFFCNFLWLNYSKTFLSKTILILKFLV